MKWTESSMVLGANWRLANAKSSMVHENNPDAACMDEIERTERKSSVQANPSRIAPAKPLCEWLFIFLGRADFDFFVRFEDTESWINARRHAGSSQLCLLACVVALWSARTYFAACAGWLRCAVLCLRSKASKETQEGSPTNNTIVVYRLERW